jgi:1,4-dihydroxy-2-naphthoyl-CoA hydrolase
MDAGESLPFATLIGLEIIDVMPERAAARIKIRPELCNRSGVASGGAVMALANTLGTVATMANLPNGANTITTESTTNFIAPVPMGDMAHAECTLVHNGQEMMVWQTKITRGDGRLAAVVTQTQMIRSADH